MHWHVSRKTPKIQEIITSGFDGEAIEAGIIKEMAGARNPRRTSVISAAVAIRLSINLAGRRNHFRDVVLYRLAKLAGNQTIIRSSDDKGRSCWAWP